jgi:TPP-dependent pyruvate/acetoin dehydrogenase alpha subunit
VDGNDLLAVRKAVQEAVARARGGGGPTLIEAVTYRMGGHSTSDDPTRYVPKEELERWAKRDPLSRFEKYLERQGLWTPTRGEEWMREALEAVSSAARTAEQVGSPPLESIFTDVYRDLPRHLRRQGQEAFELASRRGDASAGEGKFPL